MKPLKANTKFAVVLAVVKKKGVLPTVYVRVCVCVCVRVRVWLNEPDSVCVWCIIIQL